MIHTATSRSDLHRICGSNRAAVSLIEVIACMALVAIMIVPLAGVIRASAQSIARANGGTSSEAKLRRSLRWLGDTIRDGDIVSVRADRLQIRQAGGDIAAIDVRAGTLILDDGRNQTVLAENVRDIRFTELTQVEPPSQRTGVSMTIRTRDPATGSLVSVDSTVAVRPQR